jgi:hypothetical protein
VPRNFERDDRDDRDDRDEDYDDRPRRREPSAIQPLSRDELKRKLRPPAIALIVVGVLYLGIAVWGGVSFLLSFDQNWEAAIAQQEARQSGNPQQRQAARQMMDGMKEVMKVAIPAVCAVVGFLSSLIIFGAVRMLTGSSHGWGMASAIIAIFPLNCYVWVLGIGFGIWAIVVLNNPRVKATFAARGRAGNRYDDRDEDYDDLR